MRTNPTHIQKIRGQYNANRKAVLYLTGMSEARLFNLILEIGLAWIREYAYDDRNQAMWLISQPIIWAWWRNEWNLRDEHIVNALYELPTGERCTRYMQMHRMALLPWRPSFSLLAERYKVAVGMMTDGSLNMQEVEA